MLVLCGFALMCALTAAVDVTTQPAMDVTQLLQQLQTEIQDFRGINIDKKIIDTLFHNSNIKYSKQQPLLLLSLCTSKLFS